MAGVPPRQVVSPRFKYAWTHDQIHLGFFLLGGLGGRCRCSSCLFCFILCEQQSQVRYKLILVNPSVVV